MNRQIKFRAMQKYGVRQGAWWYGYFSKDATGMAYITTLDGVDTVIVDEATIGQFTGLTDKNGTEIYEGDKCIAKYGITGLIKEAVVYWQNGCFFVDDNDPSGNLPLHYFIERSELIEIIGNIHQESEVTNG